MVPDPIVTIFGNSVAKRTLLYLFRSKDSVFFSSKLYSARIGKGVKCSYAMMSNTLKKLEEAGLVEKEERGRINMVTLTEKGKETAEHLDKIDELLK